MRRVSVTIAKLNFPFVHYRVAEKREKKVELKQINGWQFN